MSILLCLIYNPKVQEHLLLWERVMPAGSAVRLHAQKYTMKKSRVEIVFGRLTWMAQAQRQSACRGSTILQAKKVATTTNVDPVLWCNIKVILKVYYEVITFIGTKKL